MSTIINTRSPYYLKVLNASLASAKMELYVWTGLQSARVAGDKKYTLIKEEVGDTNYVVFEISELIRDFMETEYGNYSTDTLWVDADITIYDSSGTIVQVNSQDVTTNSYLAIDGYGYFEEGVNPRTNSTPMVLQSNINLFFHSGYDIKIPVFAEAATVTATLSSSAGASVNWEAADEFWDTYDITWGSGSTPVQITDSGNSDQKIQYLIITDTENLNTGDTVTFSSLKDSGTTTATTTNKLVDSTQNFTSTVRVGDLVSNTTDSTTAIVTAVDSDTTLSLSADIMASGETYQIKYQADIVITLTSVAEARYTPLNVIFYNKFGALQNIWFFKKSVTSINVTSENYKSNILDLDNDGGEPSYVINKHQEKIFMVNGRETITLSTDFISEEYNDIIRQMLLSEQVWVDDETNVLPINLDSKSLEFRKGVNDRFVNYTISFKYAFDKINNIL